MRFFVNTQSNPANQLVNAFGGNIPLTAFQMTRRDACPLELAMFTGEQGGATPVLFTGAYEIRFALKRSLDFTGPAIVHHADFVFRPADQVYRGSPSTNTIQLASLFCQASAGWNIRADDEAAYTLVVGDKNKLVASQHAEAVTFTVPSGLGADGDIIYVMQAGLGQLTLAGSGVTLTVSGDATLTPAKDVTLKLLRTAANEWTVSIATELEKVDLMGEWTWRELASPDDWASVPKFTMTVTNDVIRGNETAPTDAGASTIYATKADLAGGFVRTDVSQDLSDEQKQQARDNIGVVSDSEVVKVIAQTWNGTQKGIARSNIDAASIAAMTAAQGDITTLQTQVGGKASSGTVTALSNTVSALDAVVIKKTAQTLTDEEKAVARDNIGAQAQPGARQLVRQAATWNAAGSGTTIHLNGALHAATGTATARAIALFDAGHAVSSYSGSVITSNAHGGATNQPCQALGALLSPLVAGTTYYLRDVTTNSFALAATPGGAAITLSGSLLSSFKIALSTKPFAHHRRIGFVSAATAGSIAGTRHGVAQWALSAELPLGYWTFAARFGVSDAAAVANARLFVGMAATIAALPNANPSAQLNIIGIGADTGDANLQIMRNDSSGTATKIDLGASFPANTRSTDAYDVLLTANADLTVTYTVTNLTTGATTSGNLSTDLPNPFVLLAPQLWRNNGTTAIAVGLDVMQWALETSK